MSTPRHWRCGPRRADAPSPRWPRPAAFTLIELLVVVAIIAMLVSILLPSLGSAREQARAVVCGQLLRQFGNGLQTYGSENQDYIPGVNTSGVGVEAKRLRWGSDVSILYQSKLPVQTFDWITPVIAYSTELPAVRAERYKMLVQRFGCPSQRYVSSVYETSGVPDMVKCRELNPYPAVSYLMSAHFQYVGQEEKGRVVGNYEHPSVSPPIYAKAASPAWEVVVERYLPKLTKVGPAGRKVFAADGTRYLDVTLVLDHDLSPGPMTFGSFTCAGGWWAGSTAWGVKGNTPNWDGSAVGADSPSHGQNLAISYRHGNQRGVASGSARDNKGTINAVFFDGHVDRLTDRQSREAQLWYPSGATVKVPTEGMTNLPMDFVIP